MSSSVSGSFDRSVRGKPTSRALPGGAPATVAVTCRQEAVRHDGVVERQWLASPTVQSRLTGWPCAPLLYLRAQRYGVERDRVTTEG